MQQRLFAAHRLYPAIRKDSEIHRIIDEVFAEHEIFDDNPITDSDLYARVMSETRERVGAFLSGRPHVETISGENFVMAIESVLSERDITDK
jgi:hypothetical protein